MHLCKVKGAAAGVAAAAVGGKAIAEQLQRIR